MKDDLNRRIAELEEELETHQLILKQLSQPPLRMAVVKGLMDSSAEVLIGHERYEVSYDPRLKDVLKKGMNVSIRPDNLAIVKAGAISNEGMVANISEVLDDGRIKVTINGAPCIIEGMEGAKRGDSVVLDASGQIIVNNLGRQNNAYALDAVPETPWTKIGGLESVIETIIDVIETPFTNQELYARYNKRVPKGVLLSGPPGCGKTLVAKAIAYNLAKGREERTGNAVDGYFLNIKGPEILNKWVGEAEGTVRQIFASAREKSAESGEPVVVFIDEAESILKRRGSGISTDVYDSIVPQFLAEMDGLDSNYNIILVLATNRPDILDPAVLRPGRIDRKLEIPRPDKRAAGKIYQIHLDGMPLASSVVGDAAKQGISPIEYLASRSADKVYSDTSVLGNILLENGPALVRYRNLASGALIESTVQRAADYAIKRELAGARKGNGISLVDMEKAIEAEYQEMRDSYSTLLTEKDVADITKATISPAARHMN